MDDQRIRLTAALSHLRAAQIDLRKIGNHGVDVEPARAAMRAASAELGKLSVHIRKGRV